LASCYRACLTLAAEHGIQSVDFSSISTGVYGYPLPQAAPVALKAIMDFLSGHETPRQVRMVCHREEIAAVYRRAWNTWYAESKEDRM
jgi:O-acetyl-ADP-ribose deacetylase (regulator of RNase III)